MKAFWLSKTFWVNILAIAGMLIVGNFADIDATAWAEISGIVLAVINIVLRFVTGEPIGWEDSKP